MHQIWLTCFSLLKLLKPELEARLNSYDLQTLKWLLADDSCSGCLQRTPAMVSYLVILKPLLLPFMAFVSSLTSVRWRAVECCGPAVSRPHLVRWLGLWA